jgi:WD40 repeat protein
VSRSGLSRLVTERKLPTLVDLARWSPDGTQLVIERDRMSADGRQTGARIEIVRVRDGHATPVTRFSRLAFHPDWSATGDLLTFDTYYLLAYRDSAPGPSNLFTVETVPTRHPGPVTHPRLSRL